MRMKLETYRLGDFLKRNREGIYLQDHVSYKRATIKINNKGIIVRDVLLGESIKTKRQFLISKGQFLMSKIDARNGAFGIVPYELDNGIITGNFWTFDVNESIVLADFFKNFTLAPYFIEICQKASSGSTNRKYLNESKFLNIVISIPSISEQKNILKKLDTAKKHYSLLKIEIEKQENLLVKLRQSILNDLIQGELTKEWREKNKSIEPASELLKRVKSHKEQLIKDKKIKKEKLVSSPIRKEEIPFEIPKSWEWCRMQDISEKLGAGSTPKGGNSVYVSKGIMFFRSQNIYNEGLKLDNIAFITDELHEKMKGTKVLAKDILLNITGGSIGRCMLIDENFETANVSQHVAIVRMIELETREFIHNLIISPYFQDKIMDVQVGVSREGLSMTSLKTLLVPLPPIEEQKEIIEKAKYLFTNCDSLEKEIKLNKENSDKIIQVILSELLGIKNISPKNVQSTDEIKEISSREVKYNSKTVNMKLIELLKLHGRLYAKDLWKMSEYYSKVNESDSLDKFYAELKKQIEEEKSIKESSEKGYLELL